MLTERGTRLEATVQIFANQLAKVATPAPGSTQAGDDIGRDGPMEPETLPSSPHFTRLPPMAVIRSAADLYFRYCHNQPYSLFHEESFRNRIEMNEVPAHLLFALLASTVRYSGDPFFHDKHGAVSSYAQQSWKAITMPWNGLQSDAELSIVQTILLLAIIDYTGKWFCILAYQEAKQLTIRPDGRTQASWIKVGLAIRLCQDCRLMIEPDEALGPVQQEERRRVFWSFYLCDKLISCGRERPATILDDHCRLQLPGDENKWRTGEYQQTPTLEHLVDDTSGSALNQLSPFAVTVVIVSLLGRCASYALGEQEEQTGNGKLSPWNPRSKYSSLHSTILQHESELGLNEPLSGKIAMSCLAPDGSIDQHRAAPLAFAHALFYLCQCLLYHPFLLKQRLARVGQRVPQSFLNQTSHSCHLAATSLSRLIGDVKSLHTDVITTSYDPFYGYLNMVAGVVHAIFMNSNDQSIRQTATASYQSSIQNLKDLSLYWTSCAMMHSRLEDFHVSSDRFASLIDPAVQDVDLSANDANDIMECLDYARMSTTPRRKSQVSSNDLPVLSQLPSPFFEELVNLLPISYSRPDTPRRFDHMFVNPQTSAPANMVTSSLSFDTKLPDGTPFDASLVGGVDEAAPGSMMGF